MSKNISDAINNATNTYTGEGWADGWLDGDNTFDSSGLGKEVSEAYGFNATSRGGSSAGGLGLLGGGKNDWRVGGGGGMIGGVATDEWLLEWKHGLDGMRLVDLRIQHVSFFVFAHSLLVRVT